MMFSGCGRVIPLTPKARPFAGSGPGWLAGLECALNLRCQTAIATSAPNVFPCFFDGEAAFTVEVNDGRADSGVTVKAVVHVEADDAAGEVGHVVLGLGSKA